VGISVAPESVSWKPLVQRRGDSHRIGLLKPLEVPVQAKGLLVVGGVLEP